MSNEVYLEYDSSDDNSELKQKVVTCWIESFQVDESKVVVQTVKERRNKIHQQN